MIEQSDNTAANVLADWVGFERVGLTADAAGLSQTEMRRHFMDFTARSAGIDNTTSARDMGLLLLGIARGSASSGFVGVSRDGCRKIVDLMLGQEDRETIPAGVTRTVSVANKTGELIGVRHDIAIVNVANANAYVVGLLSCDDYEPVARICAAAPTRRADRRASNRYSLIFRLTYAANGATVESLRSLYVPNPGSYGYFRNVCTFAPGL